MDIRIKATEYEMTPDVAAYLDERARSIEKLLGEHVEAARCEIEVGRDAGRPRHGKNIFFAEIRVIYPGDKSVYARNNSESINGAIDDAKEEIMQQLRRGKRLHRRFLRHSGAMLKRLMRLD